MLRRRNGAIVVLLVLAFAAPARSQQSPPSKSDEPLRGIAEYAWEAGSMMSFPGSFCTLLELKKSDEPCPYKHIGMSNATEAKAVEVSRDPATGKLDVVIGWKTADDGYLFHVNLKGELLKALYMKKGTGGVLVPNNTVQERLQQEIDFWLSHEAMLRGSPLAR